jgi:hypothetical protein
MLFPLAVAIVAVALGAWLALGQRDALNTLGPLRVLALVAALAIIALHLLPEAFHDLGALFMVLGVAAGAVGPWALQRLTVAAFRNRMDGTRHGAVVALEVGYAGLAVHRFGDGLSMGAASSAEPGLTSAGVVLALAAHIIPVTTVMILAVDAENGRRSAVRHAAGLALATVAGVVTAGALIHGARRELSPWVSAVVAGLLLHIVTHEAFGHRAHRPVTPPTDVSS